MADKHFINVPHQDIKNRDVPTARRPGRLRQIELGFNKARRGEPNLTWHVRRTESDDSVFLPDSTKVEYRFNRRSWNRAQTKVWYEMEIPTHYGGVEYAISVKLGGTSKLKEVAKFVTWRRVYLSARCPDSDCADLFEAAAAKITKAFEPAYIDVVRDAVTIKKTPEDEVRHASAKTPGTCEICVDFKLPRWEAYDQKFELDVTKDALEGNRHWSRDNDLLVLDLRDDGFRPQVPSTSGSLRYIDAIKVTCGDEVLLELGDQDTTALGQLCRVRREGTTVSEDENIYKATDIVIDLGAAPMREAKTRLTQGKTIHITAILGLEQFGRSAGQAVPGNANIELTFYPDTTTVERMTAILTHEMAHTMQLVKASEATSNGERVQNIFFHDNSYGGQGNHCRQGCKAVDSELTVSGRIYEPDPGSGPLCTMHYKLDDGVRDGKFCKNCIAQLRRAELPR